MYRGRIAPTPSGFLHCGHAATFWVAQSRAARRGGRLALRNDDLDRTRCRADYAAAMLEDLRWFGLRWDEGPDTGGDFGPYAQSERGALYRDCFEELKRRGLVYPCNQSRKDILRALSAPHEGEEEPVYPGICRPGAPGALDPEAAEAGRAPGKINWRFLAPEGETVSFTDLRLGRRQAVVGKDIGDFVVWRHDGAPSYQLSTTVDDARMMVTEVVRGEDLIASTARQILIYKAMGWTPPDFYHCPLVRDRRGRRLAKRSRDLELRALRERGVSAEAIREAMGLSADQDAYSETLPPALQDLV